MPENNTEQNSETQQPHPLVEQVIHAVDREIKADVFARHKINILSPSCPYDHRTIANQYHSEDKILIGGRVYLSKASFLKFLRQKLEQRVTR